MQNFEYCTPTRIVFGKGVIEKLPEVLGQYGKKVLLTYGGGSIRRMGLYQKVKELLKDFDITELFGIDPHLPAQEIAEKAIEKTYAFFESMGIPMHLKEVGIGPERIPEMARHVAENEGLEHAYAPLTEQDIAEILTASL